ncbi:MAG TPA: hypothetical protein VF518_07690, partial [Polyangia bacterium]
TAGLAPGKVRATVFKAIARRGSQAQPRLAQPEVVGKMGAWLGVTPAGRKGAREPNLGGRGLAALRMEGRRVFRAELGLGNRWRAQTGASATQETPGVAANTFYANASMPGIMARGKTESLAVTLALDSLEQPIGPTCAQSAIDPSRKLELVLVFPQNIEMVDVSRRQVNHRVMLLFHIRGTQPGSGELWVTFRQECRVVLSLVLKAQIVESAQADDRRSATGRGEKVPQPKEGRGWEDMERYRSKRRARLRISH